MEECSS
jgi:hypothetical protein